MKTMNRKLWLGAILLSLGLGCGDGSSAALGSDALSITGSDVSGEQLALPDGSGRGAMDGAGRVERSEIDRLKALLALTDEQVAQIQPILDATRTALEAVRAQVRAGSLNREEAHAKVKALHEDQKAQILALLTPEQQAKWSDMREHHCGPFDITRLSEALGLSADQVAQITSITSATQAKVNDIHTQVEAGSLSKEDARAQIEQIMADTKAAIDGVLTEEQKAELAKLMRHRRGGHGGPPPGGPPPGGPPPGAPPPGGGSGGAPPPGR
jgi:Spy/CpxP family protein refolding chaperone